MKAELMSIHFEENTLTAKQFLLLRQSVGGTGVELQIEKALESGLYTILAKDGEQVVGMGRLVGDGFTICYIQDLIVLPEYQGKGIGTAIMEKLIDYIKDNAIPNTYVTAGLFSAKGKESFYEKFGFYIRPNENRGAGMEIGIKSKIHD